MRRLPPPFATRRANTAIGIVLLLVAAALAPTRLAEHAAVLGPLPGNLDDLRLIPMAGVLSIAELTGLIWW